MCVVVVCNADSMVVSHMSETMQEKTNFEGFTYKGGGKL